uniref:Uncharacterized protein n=1 Tax=Arundo donax TaxID=35708 RepID=A0A0A9AB25_ARUDO
MESSIGDYRPVDGINVAHAGRTVVSLSRFGGGAEDDADARGKRTCTCMEETWSIEEADFNIVGLSKECFLPPRDLVPGESKPVQKKDCAVDHSGKKDDAVVDAAKSAIGACGQEIEVKGKNGEGVVCPAAGRKVLVSAATGLGWFGPAKVVAVDTVDADE